MKTNDWVGVLSIAAVLLLPLGGTATAGPSAPSGEESVIPGRTALEQARAAGASDAWWQQVSRTIQVREYHIRSTDLGLQAPNRAQDLRAFFREDGIAVVPRVAPAETAPWRFEWRTVAWGRDGVLRPLGPATLRHEGPRVELVHADGLVEWYENRPEGIEQGFRVDVPPEELPLPGSSGEPAGGAPSSRDGLLVIAGRVPDGLGAALSIDGREVSLSDRSGTPVLRYGDLHVRDAVGREIASSLSLAPGEIRIRIEDAGATYPLVVDPLMTSPASTKTGEQAEENLGWSVATAGDVNGDGYSDIVVGAPGFDDLDPDDGIAFVFWGSASGVFAPAAWEFHPRSLGVFGSHCGFSVACAGDVNGDGYDDVVIGAPQAQNGGKAFVFLGPDLVAPPWTAGSYHANNQFGYAVSTAGDANGDGYDEVLIGEGGPAWGGFVYLFRGGPDGLEPSHSWIASGLGRAVATAGDVNGDGYSDVILGDADYGDTWGTPSEGIAYVFHGQDAASPLSPYANWTVEGNLTAARFGYSVSTAGDVNGDGYADVIVGADGWTVGQSSDVGKVFVFQGGSGGLSTSPAWTSTGTAAGMRYGSSVATAGDVNGDGYADVVIGAKTYTNGQSYEGLAVGYLGGPAGLASTEFWRVEPNWSGAIFGHVVATAGDFNGDGFSDVVVAAPYYTGSLAAQGIIALYHGSADGLSSTVAWTHENNKPGQQFGLAVADAGDVNGDGYGDVIVGSPYYDDTSVSPPRTDAGRAFVFQGSPTGPPGSGASWNVIGNRANGYMGYSVAGAGDVNGDGFDDVVVGSYGYTNGQSQEGRAQVFLGSPTGLSTTAAWSVESNRRFARFGYSVASAGDVNDDGYADVLVGAPRFDNPELEEGRATLYLGSGSGLATTPAWIAESNQNHAFFGIAVSSAGDVNRDGFSDWVVGADLYTGPAGADEGAAFLYLGTEPPLSTAPAWTVTGGQVNAYFGRSVGSCGDVNGDGFSDVIIGAPGFDNGQVDEGRALVYHGWMNGLWPAPNWSAESNAAGALFGTVSKAGAGDVNGDGFSDVIVGAQAQGNGGMAFAYLGSAGGLAKAPHWTGTANQAAADYGAAVSTAGDVNGDGYADVIVGARRYDNGQTDEGRVYAHLGNQRTSSNNVTRPWRPGQYESFSGNRISLLGESDAPNSFRIMARGWSPAGRTRVRLEWQWNPLSSPLGGTPTHDQSYDSGPPGNPVELNELVEGASAGQSIHWRLRVATDSPYFPWSHWVTISPSVPSTKQLRTRNDPGPELEKTGEAAGSPPAPASASARLAIELLRPNPFHSETAIAFRLPAAGSVRLVVYDVSGRRVATLLDRPLPAGRHVVSWDGRNASGHRMPAGVYFARLAALGQVQSRSVRLIR